MDPDLQISADVIARATEMLLPLLKMAETESPRTKVILYATRIDEELDALLKKFLKPRRRPKEEDDELFRAYAPLSTFSGRISMAHRLGLLSRDDADSLDTLRSLRNDCAHKIFDFRFDESPAKERTARFIELTCRDPSRLLMLGAFACPQTDEQALIFCCLFHVIYLQRTGAQVQVTEDKYAHDIFGFKEKLAETEADEPEKK